MFIRHAAASFIWLVYSRRIDGSNNNSFLPLIQFKASHHSSFWLAFLGLPSDFRLSLINLISSQFWLYFRFKPEWMKLINKERRRKLINLTWLLIAGCRLIDFTEFIFGLIAAINQKSIKFRNQIKLNRAIIQSVYIRHCRNVHSLHSFTAFIWL